MLTLSIYLHYNDIIPTLCFVNNSFAQQVLAKVNDLHLQIILALPPYRKNCLKIRQFVEGPFLVGRGQGFCDNSSCKSLI